MKKTMKSILLAATALTLLATAGAASAQTAPGAAVVFLPSPSTENGPAQCRASTFQSTTAAGISADGRTVAGTAATSNCIVLWRDGTPQVQAGSYPGNPAIGNGFGDITGLSGNGQAVVGYTNDQNGSLGLTRYWTAATDLQFFPVIETLTQAQFNARFPSGVVSATGPVQRVPINDGFVNGDGNVFALNSAYSVPTVQGGQLLFEGRVVVWRRDVGYTELPTFETNTSMEAAGIDSSGNRVAGTVRFITSREQGFIVSSTPSAAFVWDAANGLTRLPDLASTLSDPALVVISGSTGISRDGSTVLGYSRATDGIFHPVFWRGGTITDLGFLSSRSPTSTDLFDDNAHEALAASAGGTVIVGRVGSECCGTAPTTDRAWRWSAATGMQELQQIALSAGLNLNGYILYEANGISDDGQYISGNSFNAAQGQSLGFVLQLAQVTQSRLIVTIRLPGVTQTSIVNQTFSTQVDAKLNGATVFTRTVTDPITGAAGVTALADARASLQQTSGLRRVVIGAPVLISNTTTVLGTTNSTVDIASGTSTSTATVNTFGPATVATGNLGTCATPAANNTNPTGCSLPGTPVSVDAGILNSNVFTNTINSVTPTTTPTVNQLITAKWQVSATAGNQFGTVHALVGPVAFERGDRLIGQLIDLGAGGQGSSATPIARAAFPIRDANGADGATSGLTMFGAYFGNWSRIDADARVPVAQVRGNTDGFVLGLDKTITAKARIGVAVDYGTSSYDVRDAIYPEALSMKQTQLGLFANWQSGGFALDGAAAFGFGTVRTTLTTPTTPATASRDVRSWSLGAQAGYGFDIDATNVRLVAGVRHVSAKLNAFTETGGPTPLTGLAKTVTRTRLYGGVEVATQFSLGTVTLTPRVHARVASDSGDPSGAADLVFASAPNGPVMQAVGPGVGKTVAELGGSLDAAVGGNVHVWAGYDGSFRSGARSHAAKAGLTVTF